MTLRDTVNEVRANLVQVTSRAEAAADATNSAHQQAIEQHRTDVDQARVVAREVEGAMRELATEAEVMKGEIATLSTAGKALEEEVVALKTDLELERRARGRAAVAGDPPPGSRDLRFRSSKAYSSSSLPSPAALFRILRFRVCSSRRYPSMSACTPLISTSNAVSIDETVCF